MAWTARFEAYSPENAAILAVARQTAPTRTVEHLGNVAVGLVLDAGFNTWDGKTVTMPPNPTAEQVEALKLLEQLLAAVGEYTLATGDRFPLPVYGLG